MAAPGTRSCGCIRPDDFYRRLAAGGLIGFGESYMAGDWDADDLAGAADRLRPRDGDADSAAAAALARHRSCSTSRAGNAVRPRRSRAQHRPPLRPVQRAVRAVPRPDAELLLGAVRGDPGPTASRRTRRRPTSAAQQRKIERLLDVAGVRRGHSSCSRSAPAGASWRIRAAQRGATVTTVTLSERAGASSPASGSRRPASPTGSRSGCCDYREVTGSYRRDGQRGDDRGGRRRTTGRVLPARCERLLPGGRVGLQAITMPHDRMLASRDTYTWIQKYIFPGGLLPSVQAIERNVADAHRADGRSTGTPSGCTTPRRCAIWREASSPMPAGVDGARLRRDVPPDVDALPGLLRGRLPLRLPRRRTSSSLDQGRHMTVLSDRPRAQAHGRDRPLADSWPSCAVFGGELPVRIRAWDGSEAGPADAPVADPALAARRCAGCCGSPDELGLAGLRHRRARRRGRPRRRRSRRVWAARSRERGISRRTLSRPAEAAEAAALAAAARRPRPAAAGPAVAGEADRAGCTPGARPAPRSPTTTTCRTSSTR